MKTEYTKFQKFLELLGIILIILSIGFITISWGSMPDKIPGHYNIAGEVDRWGSKWEVIILPTITIGLYLFMSTISAFPKIWNVPISKKEANKYQVYSTLKTMLILIKIEVITMFFLISYFTVKARNLPIYYRLIFMVVIFGTVGYYTWRSYKEGKK